MKPKRADKKNFSNKAECKNSSDNSINTLIYSKYDGLFKAYTKSCTHVAEEYLAGLLVYEKGQENMERMVGKVNDSDYKRYIHFLSVSKWSASDVNSATMKAAELVITKSEKIKYSLSNGDKQKYTNKEWAYFQCSRYWVERCFDDCKNELGMSGYQVNRMVGMATSYGISNDG